MRIVTSDAIYYAVYLASSHLLFFFQSFPVFRHGVLSSIPLSPPLRLLFNAPSPAWPSYPESKKTSNTPSSSPFESCIFNKQADSRKQTDPIEMPMLFLRNGTINFWLEMQSEIFSNHFTDNCIRSFIHIESPKGEPPNPNSTHLSCCFRCSVNEIIETSHLVFFLVFLMYFNALEMNPTLVRIYLPSYHKSPFLS